MFSRCALIILILLPLSAAAQTEDALRQFFEGKTVVTRIDLPASKAGVDIHPGTPQPLDFSELGKRLKTYGISLHSGQSALVTLVKVKERNIEFHLGGGGYGTFGDDTGDVSVSSIPKSRREKDLERDVRSTTDPATKRRLQDDLDRERRDREREDARQRSIAAIASEQKKTAVRQRALDAGSRFNIWYPQPISTDDLRPEKLTAALAKYLSFSGARETDSTETSLTPNTTPLPARSTSLRKGMTLTEVSSALGEPLTRNEQSQGDLRVLRCTYLTNEGHIDATFVEDVLVRYTISSR